MLCTVCGRSFRDEVIQEIYALTGEAKRLLDGSRWMTVWLTELLISAGVERDRIAWNATAGDDEIDIMIDAPGPRVFLELKDREFGLGDAYPFAFRVTRYGGTRGVIVSTDQVASEAKRFFTEQRSNMEAEIEFLEGADAIENGVESLVDRISRSGVNELLGELSGPFGVNLIPIMRSWMDQRARRQATDPTRALDLEMPSVSPLVTSSTS